MKSSRNRNVAINTPEYWVPRAEDTPRLSLIKARGYMRMVGRLQRRLNRLAAPLFKREKITSTQYIVLLWVKDRPGIVQRELIDLLDLDPNTISDVVRRLQ